MSTLRATASPLRFFINTENARYVTSEPYLSFNIDAASLYQENEFGRLNFTDRGFLELSRQFCAASPGGAVLRIGGSAADDLVFTGDDPSSDYTQRIHVESTYWDSIVAFADATGCRLVWDLCALSMRNEADNSWDSRNAAALFDHIAAKNQRVFGFQLGNEPGHWYTRHENGPTGAQIGQDFLALQTLVREKFGSWQDPPLLLGPDVCGPGELTDDHPCADYQFFWALVTGGEAALDGVTIHHYGLKSAKSEDNNCRLEDFTNPAVIFTPEDVYYQWRTTKDAAIGSKEDGGVDLILGEMATSATGGCPDLSNSFAAGFWYVHNLGEVAAVKYDQVYRQDFLGWSGIGDVSYYTLAGDPGWSGAYYTDESGATVAPVELIPNPDFFTSVLWKNLMGQKILDVQHDVLSNPMVQGTSIHAQCATDYASKTAGSIVLAFANTNTFSADIEASMFDILGYGINPRVEYFLTSGDDSDLSSRSVRLNGADEVLTASTPLTGRTRSKGPLVLPASSYGFIVFPEANAMACM